MATERERRDDVNMQRVRTHGPRLYADLIALIEKHAAFSAECQAHFETTTGSRYYTERLDLPLVQLQQIADVYKAALASYGIAV